MLVLLLMSFVFSRIGQPLLNVGNSFVIRGIRLYGNFKQILNFGILLLVHKEPIFSGNFKQFIFVFRALQVAETFSDHPLVPITGCPGYGTVDCCIKLASSLMNFVAFLLPIIEGGTTMPCFHMLYSLVWGYWVSPILVYQVELTDLSFDSPHSIAVTLNSLLSKILPALYAHMRFTTK